MTADRTELAQRPAALTALVFALALTAYLLTFDVGSDGLILGNDVVPYGLALTGGSLEGLWNPHHLLFHPLAGLTAEALARLSGRELDLEQVLRAQKLLSAVGGALAVALVFRFAARRCGTLRAALLGAAFAASAGCWLYSAVGETYMPANAALVGLLACAVEGRLEKRESRPHRHIALFAWLTLAVLLRQDSILVVPALALILPLRRWLLPTAAAGALTLGVYALAWRATETDLGLLPWLRGLADTGDWGRWLGPRAFGVSAVVTGMSLTYALWHWTRIGSAIVAVGLSAFVPPRRWSGPGRRAVIGLAVFALARFGFFAWWQPSNMEYHTGTLVPLVLSGAMLVGTPENRKLRWQVPVLALFVLAIAIGNWIVLIGPNRGSTMAERSATALEAAGPNGLVVAVDQLQYYALQRAVAFDVAGAGATELIDVGRLMPHEPGVLPPELRPLRDEVLARMTAARTRSGAIVFVRDLVLPRRLHWDHNPITGLVALLPPGIGQPLTEPQTPAERERDGNWAWIVRP